ncbi:hypothetical protein ACFLRA_01165 [Bdellovibrionota bacterium]
MEKVKKTKDFTIFKKRSGRYCIKSNGGKWITGVEKVKILLNEKLIKTVLPKKEEEAPPKEVEETKVEEAPKEAEETKEEPTAKEGKEKKEEATEKEEPSEEKKKAKD